MKHRGRYVGDLLTGDFVASGSDYTIGKSFDIAYSSPGSVIAFGADQGHNEATDFLTLLQWELIVLALFIVGLGTFAVVRRRGIPAAA